MEDHLHHEARSTIGVNDAVLLHNPNSTEDFIDNLRKRFKGDIIYTYIGPVLISVNPYRELPIYEEERILEYSKVNFIEVPPHIFGIAGNAYRQLMEDKQDQCVLISGESGSGKTEASKKLLQYIASVTRHISSVEKTKDKLLQSNPLLEAFGNAQTNRNDNSSRFGKYMDIEFDFRGSPVGGHILNYLLEKSRVVHQANGERNFHIFYQILGGLKGDALESLGLTRNPNEYFYLKQGNTMVTGSEDGNKFKAVKSAMKTVGFSKPEQNEIYNIIAGILHIGNTAFIQDGSYGQVASVELTKLVANLLGCSAEKLTEALTHKSIEVRDDFVTSPLPYDQITYARDALAKAIYERLFTWLVRKLNASLKSNYTGKRSLLGILDIYGFEIFDSNSFEQFCINYCNEKLQQLFIELTLKSEQEEYRKENIEWEHVEYFNNKIICDLIEEKHKGIIYQLDEECLLPGDTTDFSLLDKMDRTLSSHPHYLSHKLATTAVRKSLMRDEFRLIHYAGEVTYKVNGFLDKNNDLLFRDLREAMSQSTRSVLQAIFPVEELKRKKRPDTAGTQFKSSVNELMEILMSKEPSYIRCIKPNDFKKSGVLDLEIVGHQVKYLGLMENLRVRRAGFAYRRPYDVFLERYKSLCPKTWPKFHGSPDAGVEVLMKHLGYTTDDYRMGRSKLFIRHAQTIFTIEDAFQARKHDLVSVIKACWKGQRQRKLYLKEKASILFVQRFARRWLAKRVYERRKKAASVIRKFVKGFIHRHEDVNEANGDFLKFVRYRFLMTLKDSLPKAIIGHDASWPSAPPAAKQASNILCSVHRRHLVRKYVRGLNPERKRQLELKYLAQQLFKGKKASYNGSIKNYFLDTRASSEQKPKIGVLRTNLENSGHKIVYITSVTKYDRHGYKPRERILVLTNKSINLYDGKDSLKLKLSLPLNALPGLTVTTMGDGLLIVRVPTEDKQLKGDLILNCPHVIEAVTRIIQEANGNKNLLTIQPPGKLNHQLNDGKQGIIDVRKGDPGLKQFTKKDGQLILTTSG